MKNYVLPILISCIAIMSCMVSCAPTGRLVMVKAHPSTRAIAKMHTQNKQTIATMSVMGTAAIIDTQKQMLTMNTHEIDNTYLPAVKSISNQNNTGKTGVVNKHVMAISTVHGKAVAAFKPAFKSIMRADDGYRNRGVGGAIVLMIVGILLTLFFVVPVFGYLIGIAGCILFVIGLIDLVLTIL